MYRDDDSSRRQRAAAGVAALAIHAGLGAVLIWGLAFAPKPGERAPGALTTVDFTPPPQPPPPPPEPAEEDAAPAEPAPEGKKGEALPKEAPEVAIPLAPKPAAPVAESGRDASAGAGNAGSGTGAGGVGQGSGGGGQGGVGSPPRKVAGELRDRDYPKAAEAQGLAGVVGIGFRVRTDGRVDRCTVTRSSGHAILDDLTCRLVSERFRFRPATNAAGTPIESTLQTSFTWGTRRR